MSDDSSSTTPNYAEYTLADLYDVQEHIDATEYPERAAAIEREIQARLTEQQSLDGAAVAEEPWVPRASKQAIGGYLIVSGMLTIARILDFDATIEDMPRIVGYLIPTTFFGTMIISGVLLLRRKRIGLIIGMVVLALQVPMIRVGRLLFTMTAVPTVELKLWPSLGFTYTASHTTRFWWANDSLPLYLGLNLTACAMLGWLSYHYERQELARERLRQRQARSAG